MAARTLYRSLIAAGKSYPVSLDAVLNRNIRRQSHYNNCTTVHHVTPLQDYNMQAYILRRTREEFRLSRNLDSHNAALRIAQVRFVLVLCALLQLA